MRILLVDDDFGIRTELQKGLVQVGGYSVETASNGLEAIERLEKDIYDLVLTDVKMPEMDGLQLLRTIKGTRPEIMVIMMTGFGSIQMAVEAIQMGANDFIAKPIDFNDLLMHLAMVEKNNSLQKENRLLRLEVEKRFDFGNIIGKSKKMQEVFSLIEKVAPSNSSVIIYGSSGTGKELVAKAIHYNSPRAKQPFIPFNSGAIPETLIESELFGHVKGAFTGAVQTRKGRFEEAAGGTLFLDEIGTIEPFIQVKLLRVLQEKEIVRVGSNERIKVDVRVIAATNEILEEKMKRGQFREDLFYRLHVFPISLPDLQDRPEDIPLLANHFLRRSAMENKKNIKGVSKEAMEALMEYSWPGNVREVENVIERAAILAGQEYLTLDDLPVNLREKFPRLIKKSLKERKSLEEVKNEYIEEVLREVNGNKQVAAEILKVSPKTLYRLAKKK